MNFLGCYFLLSGLYIYIRKRSLSKGYKASKYADFLTYFEREYLKTDKNTWRRKYSWVYNSKVYFIFSVLIAIMLELVAFSLFFASYYSGSGGR